MLAMFSALKRVIARWMTVHASRISQQFSDLGEDRARSVFLIANRFKLRWTFEILGETRPRFGFRKRG
jgi:hypothetical protein